MEPFKGLTQEQEQIARLKEVIFWMIGRMSVFEYEISGILNARRNEGKESDYSHVTEEEIMEDNFRHACKNLLGMPWKGKESKNE